MSFLQMKQWLLATVCALAFFNAHAQNEVDAIRYTFQSVPGTARSQGMGGAFGAIGADIGSIFCNPAGLGVYRRGEAQLGLVFQNASANATYIGQSALNDRFRTSLNNFGYVTSKLGRGDWYFVNYALAYSRVNNYNQNVRISGVNDRTSLLEVFRDQANGNHYDSLASYFPFGADLAWYTYGIDTIPGYTDQYQVPFGSWPVNQSKTIERTGFTAETALAISANYRDQLYIGGNVGIVRAQYTELGRFREEYAPGNPITSMTYVDSLSASGFGLLLRLGVIAKLKPNLKVGFSLQTACNLGFDEVYQTRMSTNFATTSFSYSSPRNSNSYAIRMPSRYMVSVAYNLGNAAILSADYVYTNFSRTLMRSTGSVDAYDYASENETISRIFRGGSQVRLGLEYRLFEAWRVRGGFNYLQSPLNASFAINTPMVTYSGGVGYRKNKFFVDLACTFTQRDETYFPYDPNYAEEVVVRQTWTRIFVTAGFRLD